MSEGDSAARRLHSLLMRVGGYWDAHHNLHSAWQAVFEELGLGDRLAIGEIHAELGRLLGDLRADVLALDPNPPKAVTLDYFSEYSRVCFGAGHDPSSSGLTSARPAAQAVNHLLVVASLSEVSFGRESVSDQQLELLSRQAEDLLKELRADVLLPREIRLRLILAVTEVADDIHYYRVRGTANLEKNTVSLAAQTSSVGNDEEEDGVISKLRAFVRYCMIALRLGQSAAALIEGDVDKAIERGRDAIDGELVDDEGPS